MYKTCRTPACGGGGGRGANLWNIGLWGVEGGEQTCRTLACGGEVEGGEQTCRTTVVGEVEGGEQTYRTSACGGWREGSKLVEHWLVGGGGRGANL